MEKYFKGFDRGLYSFQETERPGHFLFYRIDKQELENIDNEPMDMLQEYIAMKMIEGDITEPVVGEVEFLNLQNNRVIGIIAPALIIEPKQIKKEEVGPVKKLIRKVFKNKK